MRLVLAAILLFSLAGCAQIRQNILEVSREDLVNVEVAREVATNSMKTRAYNSGFLRCSLGTQMQDLPTSTTLAWDQADQLTMDAGLWSEKDFALGCYLGLQVRMTVAQVEQILKQVAPKVLQYIPSALLW